jgi:hypothetical protein
LPIERSSAIACPSKISFGARMNEARQWPGGGVMRAIEMSFVLRVLCCGANQVSLKLLFVVSS